MWTQSSAVSRPLTHRLRKAWALSRSDWLFLIQASGLLVAVELGLKMFRFNTLLRLLEGKGSVDAEGRAEDQVRIDRMAYLVDVASRYHVLKPTCLTKGLVLYGLLRRKGVRVELVIGTLKAEEGLEAHAWLEHHGRVILGGAVRERYAPLRYVDGGVTSPKTIGRLE